MASPTSFSSAIRREMETERSNSDCQHFRFPVTSNISGPGIGFQSLILDADIIPCIVNDGSHGMIDWLSHGWASLLHTYARRNFVCFRTSPRTFPSPLHTNDQAGVDDFRVCLECSEMTIARYYAKSVPAGEQATLERRVGAPTDSPNMNSNAGLVLSGMDSCKHMSKECDLPSLARDLKHSTYDLDLILYVSLERPHAFLLFRHPGISYPFAKSIKCMLEHVLRHSKHSHDIVPDELSILTPQTMGQLQAWNPMDPSTSKKATCLHHLVEHVAHENPEAEAVCAWDGSLSYRTLNMLADIVAKRLRALGVKPGIYVPFAYEKSMWAIVACLGILKAGGAFVPISIYEPDIRFLAILKSIAARVIVTSRPLEPKFSPFVVEVLVVDANTMGSGNDGALGDLLLLCSDEWAPGDTCQEIQPADPVFVLFTSGSTGQPKGIIHNHESICTQWLLQGRLLGYRNARVLQFAAHTFDVFIIDVFTALLYGGCVCVPSEEERQNNIVGVINQMKADYATLTPSFAGLIEPSEVPTLKTLSIGGEALPQDRVQRWAEKVRFIQIYGPAEVGICLAVDMQPDTTPETVGFPLPNCSCWLVDPENSDCLVPIGATGELIVAGPSIALGYLNDDAKTQITFIGPPSWAHTMGLPFTRFYKTGDLLKLNVDRFDGSYDFVGRKDSQIKLRGQRIEPGEVEYHLGNISGVIQAMVTKPESGSYAGHLVAVAQTRVNNGYFQTHLSSQIPLATQPKLSLSEVRDILSKSLPSYMIPRVYLEVDAIPCVPSMKIDRRLVQTWLNGSTDDFSCPIMENYPVILEDGTARYLSCAISVLLEQRHGRQYCNEAVPRDFVVQDMGIDSIQVISLAMLIKRTYSVKIPTSKLLDPSTTIRHLAEYIDSHMKPDLCGNLIHTNGFQKHFELVHEVETLCDVLNSSLLPSTTSGSPSASNHHHIQCRNIFLTGATGFLGIAILHNLLEQYQESNIYTLVRCPSEHAGLLRLLQALDFRGHWKPAYLSRLFVIPGDLNTINLGISAPNLAKLQFVSQEPGPSLLTSTTETIEIDTIIHAGAKVHYSTSYTTLKETNTLSVLSLLSSFAKTQRMKRFIYVSGGEHPSTSSSLEDHDYVRTIEEEANGYTQSKVVSEKLVQFGACMFPPGLHDKSIRIVKPGYMIGDAKTGIANESDFLWRLVKGCIQIGAYDIEAVRKWVFVADVDFLAYVVIRGLDRSGRDQSNTSDIEDYGEAYTKESGCETVDPLERVLCGVWFEDIWTMLHNEFGFKLEGMETAMWMERLIKAVEEGGEAHLLFPLLDILEREGQTVGVEWMQTGSADGNGRAMAAFRKNVEYLIGVGFLPRLGGS